MAKNNELIESIRLRCVECGDCWLWQGAMSHGRTPVMHCDQKIQSVRQVMAVALDKKPEPEMKASNTCADSRCVAPDHIKIMSQKQIQVRSSKLTRHQSNPARIFKMRQSIKNMVLTWDQVREIRASGKKQTELAAEYGVAASTISGIKNHRRWREYVANPFAGLMTN